MSRASRTCPLEVIGVMRTERTDPEQTPVQAALNRTEHGFVEIFERFADGLSGLADFDYAWLLTWLDRPDSHSSTVPLRQVPFLLRGQQRRIGLFATRGPRRINPIGLSLVQLLKITGRQVHFAGVDLLDGTPVIDVKPYVSRFDRPVGEPRCGWFDTIALDEGVTPADLGLPADLGPSDDLGASPTHSEETDTSG